jgi:hypothetical protein
VSWGGGEEGVEVPLKLSLVRSFIYVCTKLAGKKYNVSMYLVLDSEPEAIKKLKKSIWFLRKK